MSVQTMEKKRRIKKSKRKKSRKLALNEANLVRGDTYPHRKALKKLGCKWDPHRRVWVAPTIGIHDQAIALLRNPEEAVSNREKSLREARLRDLERQNELTAAGKKWHQPGTVVRSARQNYFELDRFEGE